MTGIWLGLAVLAGGFWGGPAVLAIAGMVVLICLADRHPSPWHVALVLFAVIGAWRVGSTNTNSPPDWITSANAVQGTVVGSSVSNGRTQSFVLVARSADEGATAREPARLCATAPLLPVIHRGDRLQISGEIMSLADAGESMAGFLRYRYCDGAVTVREVVVSTRGHGVLNQLDRLRVEITDVLLRAAPGDRGSLLAGLATGDDATMTYEQRQAFVTTGTSHITAVSGSNFALLVMMISFAAGFAMSTRSPWRLAAVGIVIWSYAALVGGSPPALRAAIVATLALSAAAIGRRPDFITLSVVAAAVGVLLRPRDIDSLAFQLSTVSAIALVLGLGGRVLGGRLGWLRQGVYSTAVTQAATAAILVPAFGRFSLYAIPANVFIGPLCGAAFPIALFAGLTGLMSQSVATAIAFPGAVLAELTLLTVRWFAELPGANIGADQIGALPAPVWVAFGMLVVVALSKECQGGIARLVRNARSADSRVRAVAIGASAGGIAGAIAASLVR